MGKEFVIETITDAFLALDQIDDDEVANMIKPKKMNEGRSYSLLSGAHDLDDARHFMETHDDAMEIQVVDPDADSVEHVKNKEAYIGQAILQCHRCGAKRFIDFDKLAVDPSDSELYNVADICPTCKSDGAGYKLLGQVGKVEKEEPAEELPSDLLEMPEEENEAEEEPEEKPKEEAENTEESKEESDDEKAKEDEEDDDEFKLPDFDKAETANESLDLDEPQPRKKLQLRFKKPRVSNSVEKETIEEDFDEEASDVAEEPENNNRPFSYEAPAEAVMAAYQNANKWLDSIKEVVYTKLNCPFFSSYIHNLAHSMPGRFDKFGDILHTVDMEIPYPATTEIAHKPSDIGEALEAVFGALNQIKEALNVFIKQADEEAHGMACAAETLLNDIEQEYPMLFRLRAKWNDCGGDTMDFDKYVGQYVDHKDDLLEDYENASYFADIKIQHDDSIDNMYGKDVIREAYETSDWAAKAWRLNEIISCMNNEEAYYGGWLYTWPDGDTREDCEYDFPDEESYQDLEKAFIRYYKRYHDEGLYEAPAEIEAAAHEWDRDLGLADIRNIKMPVRESMEPDEDEDEDEPLMIKDLLDCIVEPENIENIIIMDGDEEVFNGVLDDMPKKLLKQEFTGFNTAESKLNINVDTEEESEDIVDDFLGLFDDGETDQVVITDVESSEALFEGTSDECREKYGDTTFVSIEAPECLVINIGEPESGDEEPEDEDAEIEDADMEPEEFEGPDESDETLFEAICKANHLATYRGTKKGTAEYWINESLYDADDFDLKTIYEAYVKGYGKDLETRFKRETGYREIVVESIGEAPKASRALRAEEVAKQKVCTKCGKEVCECDNSKAPTTEASVRSFKTRQELGEAIAECKNNNKPFRVTRSKKKDYRYDLVTDEGLLGTVAAGLAGAAGAAIVNKLSEEAEEPIEESAFLSTPINVDVDLSNLGGSGNKVGVLSGGLNKLSEEALDEDAFSFIEAPLNVKVNGNGLLGQNNDVSVMSHKVGEELNEDDNNVLEPLDNYGEPEEYTGPMEIITDPIDEEPSTTASVVPADMTPTEIACMQNISRIANDISEAIENTYGIEANPALIVADILQDLRLIGGQIDISELEDTPMNRLTAAMYQDYNQMYEMVDGIISMLTGEHFESTPERKLAQAVRALEGPSFSTETIRDGIASTRFLQAARAGAVPYIGRNDIPMLENLDLRESIDFDTTSFDNALNKHLNEKYNSDIVYTTIDGLVHENGSIMLTGILESCDNSARVKFTLVPKTPLTEELHTISDVAKVLDQKDFVVTNDMSDEVFEYSLDRETPSIFFAEGRSAEDVIKAFDKEYGQDATTYTNMAEKMEAVANWEYVENLEFYVEHGYDVPTIKTHLMERQGLNEALTRIIETVTDMDDEALRDAMALKNWAMDHDIVYPTDLHPDDAPQVAREIFNAPEEDKPRQFRDATSVEELAQRIRNSIETKYLW